MFGAIVSARRVTNVLVVYISLTGQTRRFVHKLGMPLLEITPENAFQTISEPFIVIAPTYDIEATEILNDFIETGHNRYYFKGVCGSGNRNFNTLFCFTAKDLSHDYEVPLLHCFEFQGSENDVSTVKEKVAQLGQSEISQ